MAQANNGGFYCFGKLVMPPQTSIHPRVVGGVTRHPKVNTSAKPRRETTLRAIAGIEAHLARFPDDNMSQAHLSALKARAA
jgi:hypothetical protein